MTFAYISKESYFIFEGKEFSFYFWFKKRARFKFFLCISNKVVPYSWISCRSRTYFCMALFLDCYNLSLRNVLDMSERAS